MEKPSPTKHVAANVRRLRQEKGWSLAELGEALGKVGHRLTVPVLSKMELGDRGIAVDDLVALATALGVSSTVLLTDPVVAKNENAVRFAQEMLDRWNQARAMAAVATHQVAEIEREIQLAARNADVREALAQVIGDENTLLGPTTAEAALLAEAVADGRFAAGAAASRASRVAKAAKAKKAGTTRVERKR